MSIALVEECNCKTLKPAKPPTLYIFDPSTIYILDPYVVAYPALDSHFPVGEKHYREMQITRRTGRLIWVTSRWKPSSAAEWRTAYSTGYVDTHGTAMVLNEKDENSGGQLTLSLDLRGTGGYHVTYSGSSGTTSGLSFVSVASPNFGN